MRYITIAVSMLVTMLASIPAKAQTILDFTAFDSAGERFDKSLAEDNLFKSLKNKINPDNTPDRCYGSYSHKA